jgi:hypothetical protein
VSAEAIHRPLISRSRTSTQNVERLSLSEITAQVEPIRRGDVERREETQSATAAAIGSVQATPARSA